MCESSSHTVYEQASANAKKAKEKTLQLTTSWRRCVLRAILPFLSSFSSILLHFRFFDAFYFFWTIFYIGCLFAGPFCSCNKNPLQRMPGSGTTGNALWMNPSWQYRPTHSVTFLYISYFLSSSAAAVFFTLLQTHRRYTIFLLYKSLYALGGIWREVYSTRKQYKDSNKKTHTQDTMKTKQARSAK